MLVLVNTAALFFVTDDTAMNRQDDSRGWKVSQVGKGDLPRFGNASQAGRGATLPNLGD
jgi:hypothetical protein